MTTVNHGNVILSHFCYIVVDIKNSSMQMDGMLKRGYYNNLKMIQKLMIMTRKKIVSLQWMMMSAQNIHIVDPGALDFVDNNKSPLNLLFF